MSIFSFFREFIKSLPTPLSLVWLLFIAILVFYWMGNKRTAKWVLGLSLFWLLLISTPFVPKFLLATLENQNPPVQIILEKEIQVTLQDSMVHILVLGSGYQTDDRLSYCSQLNNSGLARLTEGMRLQRLVPGSMLIFSGHAGIQPLPEAVVSSLAAQELGINQEKIATNSRPWNTKSEAIEYFKRYGTVYKLYLVTDAAHMPRAIMHFRNAGLNPIPAPTNFNIRKNNIPKSYTNYFPSSGNIRYMEIVFLEYLGMIWAWIGGN